MTRIVANAAFASKHESTHNLWLSCLALSSPADTRRRLSKAQDDISRPAVKSRAKAMKAWKAADELRLFE